MMNSIVQPGSHPRFLGLDIGNRRIGVAVSDELGLTAQPVLTLERRSSRAPSRDDLRSLARLCRRFGVVGIVVGNPVHLSGETSPQAAKTQAFAAELGDVDRPAHPPVGRAPDQPRSPPDPLRSRPRAAGAPQGRRPGGGDADPAVVSRKQGAREQGSEGASNLKHTVALSATASLLPRSLAPL